MTKVKMPWEHPEDPTSKGGENEETKVPPLEDPPRDPELSLESPPTALENPPTDPPIQSPFTDPRLEGKSEQEIIDEMALLDLTVKEQGRTLTQLQQQPPSSLKWFLT